MRSNMQEALMQRLISRRFRREQGSAWLLSIWISTLLLFSIIGSLPYFLTVVRAVGNSASLDRAFQVAETGMNIGMWEIQHNAGNDLLNSQNGWANLGSAACDDELDKGTDGLLFCLSAVSCRPF